MDRKLDAWIHENLFGMELIPEGSPDSGGWIKAAHYKDSSGKEYSSVNGPAKYTSDMNEAFKLVVLLNMSIECLGGNCFEVLIGDEVGISSGVHTPEELICLAAYELKTGKDWEKS